MRSLATVVLTLDEVEALRLADLEGRYQEDGAGSMKVSRQTFGRILTAARRKVADALLNGKALAFERGAGVQQLADIRCRDCGFEWEEMPEDSASDCPRCGQSVNAQDTGGDNEGSH
jgi:predicted DNA-binding protein (UPF0251 family)